MVELPGSFSSRYPEELSGGQKQRINLARALGANPDIMLADEVTSALDTIVGAAVIELLEGLGHRAAATLESLGYDAIHLRIGDGYQGWPEAAPFDAIIVTCAPERIPGPLQEQLAEGGRLVIPVGSRGDQDLVVVEKHEGELRQTEVLPVRFVPMVDAKGRLYRD